MRTIPSPVSPANGRPSSNQALIAAAVLAALAATTPAQLQFGELPRHLLPAAVGFAKAVAFGDVDGDGDLDLVFGSDGVPNQSQNRLCRNDGAGHFTDVTATQMPVDTNPTLAVALGDVDGDGDLDIVFGERGQNRLYRNNGTGSFTDVWASAMPVDGDDSRAVALGDVDGDSDLDLVIGNFGTQNRLYLNNGIHSGTFVDATAGRMPVDISPTTSVAMGDIDGDGDLDLVFGNHLPYFQALHGTQNRLYTNNGSGTFTDVTATQLPIGLDPTTAVILGDVDGDSDLDLVVGNDYTWRYVPIGHKYFQLVRWGSNNGLLLNDGTGTFTLAPSTQMPVSSGWTSSVTAGDIDNDGDLDLVFGNHERVPVPVGMANQLALNTGGGAFVDATHRLPNDTSRTTCLALGDVEGDGDLDLAVGKHPTSALGQGRLYRNLQRQLDAPQPFRIAQTYTLTAYLRHGALTSGDFAFPAMSLGSVSIPLGPLGTLGIDPGTAVPLPLILIPQPAGDGSIGIAIPNLPSLIGLHVYSQALLFPAALPARLSNVVPDVLVQ